MSAKQRDRLPPFPRRRRGANARQQRHQRRLWESAMASSSVTLGEIDARLASLRKGYSSEDFPLLHVRYFRYPVDLKDKTKRVWHDALGVTAYVDHFMTLRLTVVPRMAMTRAAIIVKSNRVERSAIVYEDPQEIRYEQREDFTHDDLEKAIEVFNEYASALAFAYALRGVGL